MLAAIFAVVIDRFLPSPEFLLRRTGHPVQWMGWLIQKIERQIYDHTQTERGQRANGAALVAMVLTVCLICGLILELVLGLLPWSFIFEALIASIMLAHRQLRQSILKIAHALFANDIETARVATAEIVGRDVTQLNESELVKAGIESLAENFSDGLVAPLFWFALLGLPGLFAYKAINTMDSMLGYRNERYLHFGWAAAKLDDLANWLPARITALFMLAAAWMAPAANLGKAFKTVRRDATQHSSPNAGWPEATLAGALYLKLGGQRRYQGHELDLPHMGDGRAVLKAADITLSIRFVDVSASLILLALILGASLI